MRIKQEARDALLPRISTLSPNRMQSTWNAEKPNWIFSPRNLRDGQRTKLKPLKKASWRRNKLISKSLHLQYINSGGMILKKNEYLRLMRDSPDLYRSVNNQSLQPTQDRNIFGSEEQM